MNDTERQRLRDALAAAELIATEVGVDDKERFLTDGWFRSAVERQLEIIGESLNHVRRTGTVTEDDIPALHQWIALRNVIAHQYDRVDLHLIWDAIMLEHELPHLMQSIRTLLQVDSAE